MKHGARSEAAAARGPDWPVAVISAVGLLVTGYLAVTKLSEGGAIFCTRGSGCDLVQASRYALFLGLPTAFWGAGAYAAIGALALAGLPPRRWLWAFLLAVAGSSFSLYLTYLTVAEIRALCGYCLLSTALVLGLLGVLLARRPPIRGRREPTRPARLTWLGGVTAVATVLVGAGVFAAGAPRGDAAYLEALARHLAGRGAVFYGAYW